jgi:hypothetical protein
MGYLRLHIWWIKHQMLQLHGTPASCGALMSMAGLLVACWWPAGGLLVACWWPAGGLLVACCWHLQLAIGLLVAIDTHRWWQDEGGGGGGEAAERTG